MRRLVLWTLGIVALLLLGLAGMGYRTYLARQASGQLRPVGTLVDVGGGRRLHMICIGQGGPTVIFEPSMMGGASSSSAARQELSRHVRVCSYDRMGSGGSGLAPDVISVGMLVADLEQLLAAAHIPPPYILVPASIGGLVGEVFARRHPDHVAGLVFLDAASSIQLDRVAANTGWFTRSAGTGAACLLSLIELRATFCAMARGFDQTMRDVAAAPPLRSDLPMIVLSAETTKNLGPLGLERFARPLVRDRVAIHQELAKRSTNGTWRLVPGSDHLIGNSQPQAVVDAVLEMRKKIGRT